MAIDVGQHLPEATFKVMTPSGPAEKTVDEVFKGKRVVLFAVPGAFTPTCHGVHLPGFLQHFDDFKAKGVDVIACTSVNDVFVIDVWANTAGAQDKILFLSDGNAEFAKKIGLDMDGTAVGFGIRSKRYAMLVEDGVVKALLVEDRPGKAEISSAESLLASV